MDAGLIPTGKQTPVARTPFDFTTPHLIGDRIHASNEQLKIAGGYDHNFVFAEHAKGMHAVAHVVDPNSGRTLDISSTEPGVQFYSGNSLDGTLTGRSGRRYVRYAGFCLETQHYPDSPNEPSFPSTTLLPGQTFRSATVFTFGATTGK